MKDPDGAASPLRARPDPGGDVLARRLSGFGPLSEGDRARLAELTHQSKEVRPRVELASEDDDVEAATVILDGVACRYRDRADGRRQVLSFLLPGDLCDLDLLVASRTDYAVGTLSACRVAAVPRALLLDLVHQHPPVFRAMQLAKLADEARSRDWVMTLGSSTAAERLAHLLCEIMDRLQAVGLATADGCDLPLTQTDFADATGLSAVHVNRTLQTLRGQRLIELRGRKLRVPDVARLHGMAGFRERGTHPVRGQAVDGRAAPWALPDGLAGRSLGI